ncbi:hypothetical protein [Neolewinella persica]|uniref:hypothetical protein n=1 Tax=Neolewinella persica TaxID=70998 RepID=UPI00037DAFDE|nr:hypothetical protein [Neolewinella persica]
MTSRLLKAKHWQLFSLIIGFPLIFQMIFLGITTGGLVGGFDPLPAFFFPLLLIAPIWLFSLLLAWLYSVGSGLQSRVPIALRRSTRFFKVALVFPVAYILLVIAVVFPLLSVMVSSTIGGNFVLIIILGLHLFTMFCIIYCLYFSAKTIKLAELQRPVSLGDFIGEFFLLWFFPVGVWILQPRINELVKTEATSPAKEEYV